MESAQINLQDFFNDGFHTAKNITSPLDRAVIFYSLDEVLETSEVFDDSSQLIKKLAWGEYCLSQLEDALKADNPNDIYMLSNHIYDYLKSMADLIEKNVQSYKPTLMAKHNVDEETIDAFINFDIKNMQLRNRYDQTFYMIRLEDLYQQRSEEIVKPNQKSAKDFDIWMLGKDVQKWFNMELEFLRKYVQQRAEAYTSSVYVDKNEVNSRLKNNLDTNYAFLTSGKS